ncbi:MAG: hypothetical protein WC876_09100 [Candidatus Thermoplasmatota archaeon]
MPIEPLGTDPTDVEDGYRSIAQLFGFTQGQPVRFVEGEVQVQTAHVVVRTQVTRPGDAAGGVQYNAATSRTFGPNSPWRLDQVWVREATPGAGAKVVANGWVEV